MKSDSLSSRGLRLELQICQNKYAHTCDSIIPLRHTFVSMLGEEEEDAILTDDGRNEQPMPHA
jgi:hypothetical protein